MPPLAAGLHGFLPTANGGLAGVETSVFYKNDVFLLSIGVVLYVIHAVTHVLYVPRFIEYGKTLKPECFCNPPP